MSDTADLRQKADTCLRLADVASSARANELFRRLAQEYRAQAEALEAPMMSPPLAPPPVGDEPATAASLALPAPFETMAEPDAFEAAPMAMNDMASPCLAPLPEIAPSLSPQVNSKQWLAELQALRARL